MRKLFLFLAAMCCAVFSYATSYNVWIAGEQLNSTSDFVTNPEMFAVGYYPVQDSLVLRGNTSGYWTVKTTTGTTKITVVDEFVINNKSGYGIEFAGTLTIHGIGKLTVKGSTGAFNSNNVVLKDGLKSSTGNYMVQNTDVVIGLLCDVWLDGIQLSGTSDYVKDPKTLEVGYYPQNDSLVLRNNLNLHSVKTTTGNTKVTLVGQNVISSTGVGIDFQGQLVIDGVGELWVNATKCFSSTNVMLKDNLGVQSGSLVGTSIRIGALYPVWVNGEQLVSNSDYVSQPTIFKVGYYPQGDSLVLRNADDLVSLKFAGTNTQLVLHGVNKVENNSGVAVEIANTISVKGDGSLVARSNTHAFSKNSLSLSENLQLYGKATAMVAMIDAAKANVGVGGGLFSVASDKKVTFTMGNLLYLEEIDAYCLAESQFESQQTSSTIIWRSYLPWEAHGYKTVNIENTDKNNLRSLNSSEWKYLFQTRNNALYLYGFATVAGQTGIILLPDNWILPSGMTFVASITLGGESTYSDNNYTAAEWTKMEAAGAIFLPADGMIINGIESFSNLGLYYGVADILGNGCISMAPKSMPQICSAFADNQYSYRLVSDDVNSAIHDVIMTKGSISKIIRNGQLFILRDGHIYDLRGQEVR